MNIPTKAECYRILELNNVPLNIIRHSEVVLRVSNQIYDQIGKRHNLDQRIIEAVALLHDVEKTKEDHTHAGEQFLINLGYPEIASHVAEHGIRKLPTSTYVF